MNSTNNIQQIEALINQILVDEPTYFVVGIKIKPTNNIKIYFDGDEGITIEKCTRFNKKIYKFIEEQGWYEEGNFSLEVSSAGVDEPLVNARQYNKNIGRKILVTLVDETKTAGKLIAVAEADIIVETIDGKGKKAITNQHVIPFINIKQAVIQISF